MIEEEERVYRSQKLGGLLYNANDFYYASMLCEEKRLIMAEAVNVAFACELYIKAIEEYQKGKASIGHNLNELYAKLSVDVKKQVYELWRTTYQPGNEDHPYFQKMFYDNIGACAEIFERFRYANEWSGGSINQNMSLRTQLTKKEIKEQEKTGKRILTPFEKYHPLVVRTNDQIYNPVIYGGFINQFAACLKVVAEELIGGTYNS